MSGAIISTVAIIVLILFLKDYIKLRRKISDIGKFVGVYTASRFNRELLEEERVRFDVLQELLEAGDIAAGETVESFKQKMVGKTKEMVSEMKSRHSDSIADMVQTMVGGREYIDKANAEYKEKEETYLGVESFFESADILNSDNFELDFKQQRVFPTPKIVLIFRRKELVKIKTKNSSL